MSLNNNAYVTYKSNIDLFSIKISKGCDSIEIKEQKIGPGSEILKTYIVKELKKRRIYTLGVTYIGFNLNNEGKKKIIKNVLMQVANNSEILNKGEIILNGFNASTLRTRQIFGNERIYSEIFFLTTTNIFYQLQIIAYEENLLEDESAKVFYNSFKHMNFKTNNNISNNFLCYNEELLSCFKNVN